MKFVFISWNVAGLPHFFNFSGTTTNKATKLYNILKRYLEINAVVVINIQEMFDIDLIEKFTKCVSNDNYNYCYNPKKVDKFFGINSGMITISNINIDDHKFYKYVHSHGEDSFSNKGILASKINNVWFINTHMQNEKVMIGFTHLASLAHKKQLNEFGKFCKKFHSNKCMVSGDFNTNIQLISKYIDFKLSLEPPEPTINNTTPDLFFANFIPKNIQNVEAINYPELSDHKMIIMYGITN